MASVAKRKWTYKGVQKEAWQVRYIDPTGSHRGKQFETKKAADAFRRKVEREIEDGEHIAAAASLTFEKACTMYLDHARLRLADGRIGRSRYEALESGFYSKAIPFFGPRLMSEIREGDVEEFYASMMRGGRLNAHSARTQLRNLKLVEDFANKRGYMKTRPAAGALRDLRGLKRAPIRTFTIEEAQALIRVLAQRPTNKHRKAWAQLTCFVQIAAFCGLRRGEIGGLTLDHVLLEQRVLEVRHNLTEHRELKGPKTRAGIRDVPMPPHVATLLREWVDQFYVDNPQRLLFTGRGARPYQLNLLQYLWIELLKAADLWHEERPFHFHALRHFYASMLIEAGTPLPDTAIMLGHSTFDMTLQVYAHSVTKPTARHAYADRLAARMRAPAVPNDTQRLLTA